jgi:beta-phosphoglucomutase family hydrolase
MGSFSFDAVIFDLDGVITNTARVHAAAWKAMFDEFLFEFGKVKGNSYAKFDYDKDYLTYVDGKPRYSGVQSFLQSRDIFLPFGIPSDAPEEMTVCGLGNRKNIKFNQVLERDGVEVFSSSVKLLGQLKNAGIKMAIASSSKNCRPVLEKAGLLHYFMARVDGEISVERGLKGKPEPDIFLESAHDLGVLPHKSIVVEDAVSGVQAGVQGKFGFVLGIARENNMDELKRAGAHFVVSDLAEIKGPENLEQLFISRINNKI